MPGNRNVLYLTIGAIALLATSAPALAQQAQAVTREQDIVDLRVGQKVLVDDGSCPSGQIKQVMGSQLNANGVARTRTCVPRLKKH
jgi:hypothetical protein